MHDRFPIVCSMSFRAENFRTGVLTAALVVIIIVLILLTPFPEETAPVDKCRPAAVKGSFRGISNVPILSTQQKTPDCCSNELLETLFLVHTAPSHFFDRAQLRTYLKKPPEIGLVFALGRTGNETLDRLVSEEANAHNDMIILPFVDTYRNLTLKIVNAIRWIENECYLPALRSIVKVDDDVWVNLPMLRRYLADELPKRQDEIHCLVWPRHRVARGLQSKWFVTKDEYSSPYYPPYCAGLAYIVPSHLLRSLAQAAYEVPFFWIDDVYATGLLARQARIGHTQISSYYALEPNRNATVALDWSETMSNILGSTNVMFAHMNTDRLRAARTMLFDVVENQATSSQTEKLTVL